MPKLYDFKRLIKKYSADFVIRTESEGSYVDGKWIAGTPSETPMRGAIVPFKEIKIYQSGGHLSSEDRQLYTIAPIANALRNGSVLYKGRTYKIEESTDYSEYADVHIYTLKWVSTDDKHEIH